MTTIALPLALLALVVAPATAAGSDPRLLVGLLLGWLIVGDDLAVRARGEARLS